MKVTSIITSASLIVVSLFGEVVNVVEATTYASFNSTDELKSAVNAYCSDEANWASNELYGNYG